MKLLLRVLLYMLAIVITVQGCQTNTELTDADKEAMVQAVKQASQDLWSINSITYDNESYNEILKFYDENSDEMWQTEPVAAIYNLNIINKQAVGLANSKSMTENRISSGVNILKAHYSVLSDNKVLEVLEGDFTITRKDSTKSGPYNWIGTAIWADINGEWKTQFAHNSFSLQ